LGDSGSLEKSNLEKAKLLWSAKEATRTRSGKALSVKLSPI